jgi:hypothetical protein
VKGRVNGRKLYLELNIIVDLDEDLNWGSWLTNSELRRGFRTLFSALLKLTTAYAHRRVRPRIN